MTNPAVAIRALVTYAVCIPLAILVGWMLTNPLDYGTLGFFGLVALLLASPIFIRWHYPIMVFGLASPIICFFLKGGLPLSQVMVVLSLGIAVVERAMNSEKRFISAPIMTWPLLYTVAMVYGTSQLTGGIGLQALGGDVGGGKKYIAVFVGVATFFALTSRVIPKEHRNLYVALYFLPGAIQVFGDLFPLLPPPLNYINLLIPPSSMPEGQEFVFGVTRMGALAYASGALANFMLARYGLRGLFRADHPIRLLLFVAFLVLTLLGGFRGVLVSFATMLTLLFFIEGLHRTRFILVAIFGVILSTSVLVTLSDKLPYAMQRTLTIVPFLKLDAGAVLDAEGSRKWREDIWRDTWPKVPEYLLLGKGYALTKEDFTMMGEGTFANKIEMQMDKSMTALAISSDYHNGPLSTLMPFGIWGGISILLLMGASLHILIRNYRYGDVELKTINAFLLAFCINSCVDFYLIFGAYTGEIFDLCKTVGFSIALNWGVCAVRKQQAPQPVIKSMLRPRSQPAVT